MTAGSISYDEYRSLVEKFVDISNKIDDKWHLERGPQGTLYMSKRCVVVPATWIGRKCPDPSITTIRVLTAAKPRQMPAQSSSSSSSSSLDRLATAAPTTKTKVQGKDKLTSHNNDHGDEDTIIAEMEMENEDDESCMPMTVACQDHLLTYEYHVVYSESYNVPVLYVNIFRPDGKLLSLEEVWKLCPSGYQEHLNENRWATLTQQEHPLLGRPFFQLHPCHTADLMAQVMARSEVRSHRNYMVTWLSTVGPVVGLSISPAYISHLRLLT